MRRHVYLVGITLALAAATATALTLYARTAPSDVAVDTRSERSREQPRAARPLVERDSLHVSGAVTNAAGQPISGARVCAACATCSAVELAAVSCVLADARGSYAVALANTHDIVLSATAAGYAPAPVQAISRTAARSSVDLVLQPLGAKVSGTVIDALGGAIGIARVRIVQASAERRPTLEVPVDADGRFELWTAPGNVSIQAFADGYAGTTVQGVAPTEDLELALLPAGRIVGSVRLRGTETAVAGVTVRAVGVGAPPSGPAAVSGEEGCFVLGGLAPGRYALIARGPGVRGAAAQPIELELAQSVTDIRIELDAAARVIGQLTIDEHGTPCQRGYARLRSGSTTLSAAIELDGSAEFEAVAPGSYDVALDCVGYVLQSGPKTLQIGGHDQAVQWRLAPGFGLEIVARDAAGAPARGVAMLLTLPHPSGERQRRMALTADASGRVLVPANLEAGAYALTAGVGVRAKPLHFELRGVPRVEKLDFQVEGSAWIDVEARDSAGRRVDALRVSAKAANARETAIAQPLGQGRYRIGPLSAGAYVVSGDDGVNPPAHVSAAPIEVTSGGQYRLELRLAREGTLRGRVVDDGGQPLRDVHVRALRDDANVLPLNLGAATDASSGGALSDEDGQFVIRHVSPDARYTLHAKQAGKAASVERVAPGDAVVIRMSASGGANGIVVDPSGTPARFVAVHASHRATRTLRTARSDAAGKFELDGLPPGSVEVTAIDPRIGVASLQLELRAGETARALRLELATPPGFAAASASRAVVPD